MKGTQRRLRDPLDLSVRARRGGLTEADRDELNRELAVDETLQVAYLVGRDVDRAALVHPGDDALIARAANAALARVAIDTSHVRPIAPAPVNVVPAARPVSVRAIAATVALCACGLGAVWWLGIASTLRGLSDRYLSPAATPAQQQSAERLSPLADVSPKSALADAPQPSREVASAVSVNDQANNDRRAGTRPSRAVPGLSAAELFHRANAARRVGDFVEAKRNYTALIARFPTSEEARLARVSLGKLLLSRGASAAAEREFRRYLSDNRGQLGEEALVSWARSLRAMQRGADEQRVWQQLLTEYPGSVYVAQAKQRLQELSTIKSNLHL